MNYQEFLNSKIKRAKQSGFKADSLNSNLFEFQHYIVSKACEAGKYAIFADCGMGKTLMQLAWSDAVSKHTGGKILILAPLAVTGQTMQEGDKFGIKVGQIGSDCSIQITNYDQLHNINVLDYSGVVLDESSILKNFTGKIRTEIIESFKNTPYKLACTATPSPNDPMELGNHSEFLDVMSRDEMLSMFFVHDAMKTQSWRLKKHGIQEFYNWVSSWATMIAKPSDIGFSDDGYILPELNIENHEISTPKRENGQLFNDVAVSATNFNKELRETKKDRLQLVADIVNETIHPVIVWIKHNDEAKELLNMIPEAVEVKGSDKPELKKKNLIGFANGDFRVLVTKMKIAQYGLNYQHCHHQIIASLDFSFEGTYQAIRRSWRFGQNNDVRIDIITTDTMKNVFQNIQKKQIQFYKMQTAMASAVSANEKTNIEMNTKTQKGKDFKMMLGDCIDRIKDIEDNSMDFSFFSPPFSSLYTYSDNPRDLSNCPDHETFWTHFKFLLPELKRVMKSGRVVGVHGTQLTTSIGRDGYLSIINFRGDLIKAFQDAGFYFHGEVFIRKNPQLAAVRTKNKQLMHGQTKRDAAICRPGLADFVVFFRKPGVNSEPVNYKKNGIPFDLWCKLAEPIWMDVSESDVLKGWQAGRGENDERHITPTQLKPIHNSLLIYTNPNDTVFCPFAGIGSEGYQTIQMGRKFVGIELKESYYDQAVKNLRNSTAMKQQTSLF